MDLVGLAFPNHNLYRYLLQSNQVVKLIPEKYFLHQLNFLLMFMMLSKQMLMITIEEILYAAGVSIDKYIKSLKTTKRGTSMVLK